MDWSTIMSNVLGGAFGLFGGSNQRSHEEHINNQNIAFARETNAQNIAHQNYWNERNFGQQDKVNQENRDFATKMWNETNAYNSPEAAMKRLKAAGLNPYLANGQPGQAAATSSTGSASNVQAPQSQSPRVEMGQQLGNLQMETEVMKMLGGFATSYAQNKLVNQQTATQKAQETLHKFNAMNLSEDFNNKVINNKYLPDMLKESIKEKQANILKTTADATGQDIKNGYLNQLLTSELSLNEQQINKLKADIDLTKINEQKLVTDIKRVNALLPQELGLLGAQITSALTMAKYNQISTEEARQRIEKHIAELPAIKEESLKRQGDAKFLNSDRIRQINYGLEKATEVVGIGSGIFNGILKGFLPRKKSTRSTINYDNKGNVKNINETISR